MPYGRSGYDTIWQVWLCFHMEGLVMIPYGRSGYDTCGWSGYDAILDGGQLVDYLFGPQFQVSGE